MTSTTGCKGEDHIESFLAGAADAARDGQEIARAITTWVLEARKRTAMK